MTDQGATEEGTRFPPGAQILVRDEEWLVRNTTTTDHDGERIEAVGVSEFVRDEEAVFFSGIDAVELLDPEKTRLVPDTSSYFRRSRLFLEAALRKTPLPQSERGLALADRFLLDPLVYQQRPAELALSMRNLRPRVLIADVVGLGKTLEIGLTLAELIRRGRGERILVVTPQSILEQFQHELWTRFSIPLVRLDSLGLQRVQRELPSGRNPFTHYKRVIISVDTLKNIGRYRHHLERIRWDAVVIDESHNLINPGSQRRALAEILAPRTDALLLASATPHNGDKRSFADLISLLDPAAIADRDHYDPAEDLGHLYIRRTKISPEVRDEMGTEWPDRGPTVSLHCAATEAEERVFAELAEHWIPTMAASTEFGTAAQDPVPVAVEPVFAYNLLKTFLSSHKALGETVTNRVASLQDRVRRAEEKGQLPDPAIATEQAALARLRQIVDGMGDGTAPGDSAKLDALVAQLKEIGVGPRSTTRAVVFSERVRTLTWLADVVPARLGLPVGADGTSKAVAVMHGGLSDEEQAKVLESFGLADTPVRLLFTGDVASEGVNLHRQCHHLVHYDIPWSLIRIEQRNGRIDRYGQKHEPRFHALILTSATPGAKDDRTVAEKLLRREEEAHKLDGTAEAVSGLYRAEEEERRLIKELVRGGTVEEFLDSGPAEEDTALADLFGQVDTVTEHELPARAELISLFDGDTADFVATALDEVYEERAADLIGLASGTDAQGGGYFSLSPSLAPDLLHRLKALPPSYLREQRVADRMLVTSDRALAQRKLDEARSSSTTMWPEVSFLTDIHPVVEWLTDKVLVEFGRQEAPVISTPHVDGPVFLVQGIHSNALGRPTVVRWMAVGGLRPDGTGTPEVRPMADVLRDAKVGPRLARTGGPQDPDGLQALVPAAVAAARHHLDAGRAQWEERISGPLAAYRAHVARWRTDSLLPGVTDRRERLVEETADELARLLDQLQTTGRPLLRVLAVLDRPGTPDAPGTDPASPTGSPGPSAAHPSDAQAEN
ncbi:SNF2-related protein [Streptomyces sp. WY228]|uniref:SNF2-related protein n=1 Tax=Streptomyces sp. WY228 TaxID=2855836 RepID=UPI001C4F5FD3|nr:SNF2-related protein [Streptomyces sp. WY228]QXQ99433.1 DEAD/DEAH box helicase family protein [Streptomyces sp. WY228]